MRDESTVVQDTLEYQHETDTYRVEYSDGTDPPSWVIVEAIKAIADVDTHDLDPLYCVVDPEALDAVFQPTPSGIHRGDGEVSFTYHGYEVVVRSDGVIEIQALEDGG